MKKLKLLLLVLILLPFENYGQTLQPISKTTTKTELRFNYPLDNISQGYPITVRIEGKYTYVVDGSTTGGFYIGGNDNVDETIVIAPGSFKSVFLHDKVTDLSNLRFFIQNPYDTTEWIQSNHDKEGEFFFSSNMRLIKRNYETRREIGEIESIPAGYTQVHEYALTLRPQILYPGFITCTQVYYPSDDIAVRFLKNNTNNKNNLNPLQNGDPSKYLDAMVWTWSGEPGIGRSFLNFDLSAIKNTTNSSINHADLHLYNSGAVINHSSHYPKGSSGYVNQIAFNRVISPWSETTTTWSNQPGIDNASSIIPPVFIGETNVLPPNYDNLSINLDGILLNSDGSLKPNYHGISMRQVNDVIDSWWRQVHFASSRADNPDYRPKLDVEYKMLAPDIMLSDDNVLEVFNSNDIESIFNNVQYEWIVNNRAYSGKTITVIPAEKYIILLDIIIINNVGDSCTHTIIKELNVADETTTFELTSSQYNGYIHDTYDVRLNGTFLRRNGVYNTIDTTLTISSGETKKILIRGAIRMEEYNIRFVGRNCGYIRNIIWEYSDGVPSFTGTSDASGNCGPAIPNSIFEEGYPYNFFKIGVTWYSRLNAPKTKQLDAEIGSFSEMGTLSVYPNPAIDHINIGYEIKQDEELVIYSMDGKIMDKVTLNPELNSTRIETQHYPSGIYMYKHGDKIGKFIIKK